MKQDVILAGVGGQGILSIAFVIDNAALKESLNFKQAEVHGMAQRGGAVQSHLRLSDSSIYSDLIPKGKADMILSVEPLETLRYLEYLAPEGLIITSQSPYENIPDYPDRDKVINQVRKVNEARLIDSLKLARKAGSAKTQNMVMLGAASRHLIIKEKNLLRFIQVLFESRGRSLVDMNIQAFYLGQEAVKT
ncbi:indolepyruvate oxidoreductase subunit beta [bacterium]|nr:indolepyruvate oxidoreductase subunit beta [bacterium]